MNERDYYPKLMKYMEGEYLMVRIADGSMGKKPFDHFGCHRGTGVMVALEVKHDKRVGPPLCFEDMMKDLRPHQKVWLEKFQKEGCTSLIVSHHMKTDTTYLYNMTRREMYTIKL